MPVVGRLFISVADLYQFGVAPWLADYLEAGGQILAGKAHRNNKGRPMKTEAIHVVVPVGVVLRSPLSFGGWLAAGMIRASILAACMACE